MTEFADWFREMTTYGPMPWQIDLYERFCKGDFPASCNLPTGLGKTSVIHIWLAALAAAPAKVPRRLVYVVNRRTVVDQATREAEKLRANLEKIPAIWEQLAKRCLEPCQPLAISTLRGQFADNREWSADPSRPAVICGTVDMIGSRLLFSGYGVGLKAKPLHAGFLGQDTLLVHDEAHLEPAFQALVTSIRAEQDRCGDIRPLRVMALTATPRGSERPFELTDAEKNPPEVIPDAPTKPIHHVWRRLKAKKGIAFHTPENDKEKVADRIGKLAKNHSESHPGSAVLVFVNSLEDHAIVCKALDGEQVQVLTGTLRGLERDRMADPRKQTGCPIFARFLKPPKPDANETERWKIERKQGTVYLVCTSAGEVGIDISADHMVCDLVAFDRMAQRLGRVNRFGDVDATIDVVHEAHPAENENEKPYEKSRWATLSLLQSLPKRDDGRHDASPLALGSLPADKRQEAFTPPPVILPSSDILFDAWALTTVRTKMPGRPPVEPYLHGIRDWEPPRTSVAWREEVHLLDTDDLPARNQPEDLLEEYPLKPHELLSDTSERVLKELSAMHKRLNGDDCPIWLVGERGEVEVLSLKTLLDTDKKRAIENITVLLPPLVGGLSDGMLKGTSKDANDVADMIVGTIERRIRIMSDDPAYSTKTNGMRLVRSIELNPDKEDDAEPRTWDWYKLNPLEGGRTAQQPVLWDIHVGDVERGVAPIMKGLSLPGEIAQAVSVAARLHDHGKRRAQFQATLGNRAYPGRVLAKSGRAGARLPETYRHEFGSLTDATADEEFKKLTPEMQDLVLHLIAAHHGRARPHFPIDEAFDPDHAQTVTDPIACDVPRRFARLQRRYGRWGLAYLESLLRAADWAASAEPSAFETQTKEVTP